MNEIAAYLKVISLLLQYPDEAYFKALPEIKSVVRRMRPFPLKESIETFIAHLEADDPIHAQEQYTALFDMSPPTTLNVTYHLWGDGEKRARLLTLLQQEYTKAGLEKSSSELPDYLPLILEFTAAVPQTMGSEVIEKSLAGIESLVARLKPIAAHYSGPIEPLVELSLGQKKNHSPQASRNKMFGAQAKSGKANPIKAITSR